jgi:hypothetical protein
VIVQRLFDAVENGVAQLQKFAFGHDGFLMAPPGDNTARRGFASMLILP